MRYDDFVIQLEPGVDRHYQARVLNSPAGEGQNEFKLPFEADELDRILTIIDQRSGPGKREASPTSSRALVAPQVAAQFDPADLGRQLYESLFSGQVGTLYHQSLGILGSDADRGLRIRLKLRSGAARMADLEKLPWEMLCRAETRDFLGLSRLTPIVRYLDVPRPVQPIPLVDAVLRILVVISSPSGLPPLDLETERKRLEVIWGKQPSVEAVFLDRATVAALRGALSERPFHTIHFMGHGGFDPRTGEGVLYFEDESGDTEALTGADLATKLKDFKSLGLIFLNACETARSAGADETRSFSGVASALVLGGLPAVLAMQFPISDRAAIELSGAFYHRMAAGIAVDEALAEGRQAIHTALPGSMEWATPVLFVRVPDGKVFTTVSKEKKPWHQKSLLALLALVVLLTAFTGYKIVWGGAQGFEIVYSTDVEGLGVVPEVEMLADGRMRVKLTFFNETGEPQKVGMDIKRTYFADDSGRRYDVVTGTAPVDEEVIDVLQPGEKRERFLDFEAPRYATETVRFNIAGHEGKSAAFPLIEVPLKGTALEAHVAGLPAEPSPPVPPPGVERFPSGAEIDGMIEGVESKVSYVDRLPDGRMRWNLEAFNRSSEVQTIEIDYEKTYVVDDLGKKYWAKSMGAARPWSVYRALRESYSIEFEGVPHGAARSFRIVLATTDRGSFESKKVEIRRTEDAGTSEEASPPPPEPPPDPGLLPEALALRTSVEGLGGKLFRVETLSNGRMRWSLELSNSTSRTLKPGIKYRDTYLADSLGRRYGVVASDTGADVANEGVEDTLRGGEKISHWLDFDAPFEEAGELWFFLAGHNVRFTPLAVGPLRFPRSFARPPAPSSSPPEALAFELGLAVSNNAEGLDTTLRRVALSKTGRMRWTFELFNRSTAAGAAGLDFNETRLTDEYGNPYNVVAADVDLGSGSFEEILPGKVSIRHWVEFSAPLDGVRGFRLELAVPAASGLELEGVDVELPEYPTEYGKKTVFAEPVRSVELGRGERLMESSVEGLYARLTGLDRMENGRVRWNFDFVNQSGETVVIGFDHQEIYLSDDKGNRYKLLQADTNPNPAAIERDHRGPLPEGTQVSHWFEFSGPVNGAKSFIISLKSHDTDVIRFFPLPAALPD